jgi:hypothetical protein
MLTTGSRRRGGGTRVTTALSVYNSSGEAGRCDANCHMAQEPACDCCCGGRLHGCGSSAAAIERNTVDFFGSLQEAEKWAQSHGIDRPLIKAPGLRGRRSLAKLLAPYRAEARRVRRLGILPGQLPIWPNEL